MFIAGLYMAGGLGGATQDGSPLSIGTLRKMHSEILKEDRTLSIRVPSDYERNRLSYPVIYLLYGDQTEGYFAETVSAVERLEGGAEIPECIVVGIHNTDRYGDLLPVNFGGRPSGADAFMDFLEKELFPFVGSQYRAKSYRLLIGPQAGGPFGLYALACRPGLFRALILENPFSAPDSRDLLRAKLREHAAGKPEAEMTVVINAFDRAGFQDHSEANKALNDALTAFEPVRPAGLRILSRRVEEPTFVPSLELKQSLRAVFPGFYPPDAPALTGLADILAFYRETGRRLGLEIDPPAFLLSTRFDDLSRGGRAAAAREILEYALRLRPFDTNALFRMGNLLADGGDLDAAEATFRKLQDMRPDPYFAGRLEAIERMRKGSAAYALSEALKDGFPAAKTKLAELEKRKDPQTYFDEREFNALGYRLFGQARLAEAIWVFEVNTRRFPDSWNAHDSLGEGYMKAGRTKDAIRSYERSLRLNPANANAKKMLEALRR
jgi:tetratricopeptide (TPR) repeat protein